jgi:branched-chain amino acid transport system substrate-binding protein
VDVLVGSVHSGVAMAMARAAKESGTVLIVPNAGADAVTGPMCAPNIFRSSFSNWQPGYAMGGDGRQAARQEDRHDDHLEVRRRRRDGAGLQGRPSRRPAARSVKELTVPFPNVEFQALLTEIAAARPDAVFSFFAGARRGEVRQGLCTPPACHKTIPLYGPAFLDRRHAGGTG